MGIEIKLEGFEKLDHNLLELTGETGHRILRKAARAAGEVVKAAIIEAAPVRTEFRKVYGQNGNPALSIPPGAIKSDIGLRVTDNKDEGGVTATVRPGRFTAPVCEWVEYGHRIVRGGRYMNFGKRGKGQKIGEVPAHPFIRPAKESSELQAIAAAEETIADEIEKELRKMGAV